MLKGSLPDLTLPRVGSTTMRGLCSRYLKRQTKFSRMLTWETLIEAEHGMVQRLRAVFDQVLEREPGIFFSLLRLPSIGGLLRCVENALRQRDQRAASHYATEVFTQLALELWHLDQFEQEVRLPVGRRILISEVGGWWDDWWVGRCVGWVGLGWLVDRSLSGWLGPCFCIAFNHFPLLI